MNTKASIPIILRQEVTILALDQTVTNGTLTVSSTLTSGDSEATEVVSLVNASFHAISNNQRYSERMAEGNSITGEVSESLSQSISWVTQVETTTKPDAHEYGDRQYW